MASPSGSASYRNIERVDAANESQFQTRDWALFLSLSLLWGASFLLIAYSLEGLAPSMVTFLRVSLGAAALWIIRVATGGGTKITADDRSAVFRLSVLWIAVPYTLFPIAQQSLNSAVSGLLNGSTPLLVALVSVLFVRVMPNKAQLVGLALGFVGIVLISIGSAGTGQSELTGVILVLLATTCYGFAINMASPLQSRYGALTLMSTALTLGSIMVLPWAVIDLDDNTWQLGSLAAVVVLGVFGTGIAFWIMTSLVGRVGALRASFTTYLIPLVSLVLGIVFRDDVVSGLALLGAPLILFGAFLASRRE